MEVRSVRPTAQQCTREPTRLNDKQRTAGKHQSRAIDRFLPGLGSYGGKRMSVWCCYWDVPSLRLARCRALKLPPVQCDGVVLEMED